MNEQVIEAEVTTALAQRQEHAVARPATVDEIIGQVTLIQHVMSKVMKDGVHYGKVPGCGDKPTLLKPGAEKLMMTFRLAPKYEEEVIDLPGGHREYRVKCTIVSIGSGQFIGQGVGSCCTMESKFRYRTEKTDKLVPQEYWKTRDKTLLGGPGYEAKKSDGKWVVIHKVDHDNPADYYNTCLKMAKKRAHVDATITCTAAGDIFAQDIEDLAENGVIEVETPPVRASAPQPKAKVPDDKVPVRQVNEAITDFLANANEVGHALVWAYCVRTGCLPRATPLERINPGAIPVWEDVVADLGLNDTVEPDLMAAYNEVYGKDSIPGAEHASDTTAREDYTPKIDQPGWKSVPIHFGTNKGTTLGELDRKKLYGWAKNWTPEPYNGKISAQDRALRAALDEALKYMEAKR